MILINFLHSLVAFAMLAFVFLLFGYLLYDAVYRGGKSFWYCCWNIININIILIIISIVIT